jgi:uncharacterized membrane protein YbhN (UPF0104 family)
LGGITSLYLLPRLHQFSFISANVRFGMAMVLGFLLLLLIFPQTFRRLIVFAGKHFPETHPFHRLIFGVEQLNNRRGRLVFGLSLLVFFIYTFQFFILLNAFEKVNFRTAVLVVPTIFFVKSLLPISIGDLGIREGTSVFLFGHFGISSAAAFNAPILLFVINLLLPGLAGLYFLLKEKGLQNEI